LAKSLIGDLRIVLDPTRPVPEQFPGQKTPAQNAPEQRIDPRILTQRIYQVPLVVNQELAQARATLKGAGFASESIALNDAPGRRIVERSEPEAGARFPASARPVVKLYHRAQKPAGGDVQQHRLPNLHRRHRRGPSARGRAAEIDLQASGVAYGRQRQRA
jgi:hypothetical protein